MKQMDYVLSANGVSRTIRARSERARARSGDEIAFANPTDALAFVNEGLADGFRFSGRELVDKTYKRVRYAYYVRLPDGSAILSGEDWGPRDPVFEVGDIYPGGPKNGKNAVVLEVITGEQARTHMRDVIIILEERPVDQQPSSPEPATEIPDNPARLGAIRPTVTASWAGQRWIAVGGTLYYSAKWKYFPDFLRDYIPMLFQKEWADAEAKKPESERHPIYQWRTEALRFMNDQPAQPNGTHSSRPNGALAAYLTFAYDVYVVADNGGLDPLLLRRLKDSDLFQGARHELFAEATCIRAGFAIVHENEADGARRHVEFIARHKETGTTFAIEAKSKHRPGVLGRTGDPPAIEKISLRFGELVNDAVAKHPSHPLVIFIDTNLPLRAADHFYAFRRINPPIASKAVDLLLARMRNEHNGKLPFVMLLFTNHPHHYSQAHELDPRKHLLSIWENNQSGSTALAAIHDAANLYGTIPNFFK